VVISQNNARHKLQFLMGEHPLPYNMTVYQAVRQFSATGGASALNDQSETDTDSEVPLGNAGLWVHTHTIYYRPAPEDGAAAASSSRAQPLASTSSAPAAAAAAAAAVGHHRKGKSSKSSSRYDFFVQHRDVFIGTLNIRRLE
jgi:E3 ubiquitin-protein ligase TRIP12